MLHDSMVERYFGHFSETTVQSNQDSGQKGAL